MTDDASQEPNPGGNFVGRVGPFLAAYREREGLSLRAFAARTGVNRETLRKLEHGDPSANPTLETLARLMRELKLSSLEQLLGGFAAFPSDEWARHTLSARESDAG